MSSFKAIQITDKVYWVGAIDWSLRNFHGYLTSRGSSYNAFLILADKVTLIDTVKPQFYDEMMARIASVVDPASIATSRRRRRVKTDRVDGEGAVTLLNCSCSNSVKRLIHPAAVTVCHVIIASLRNWRSVLREIRWRWTLKLL